MDEPPREAAFVLPFGVPDRHGQIHHDGVLRLPTQNDLIIVLKLSAGVDNLAYLEMLLLGRMLVRLGQLPLNDLTRYEYVEKMVLPDIDHLNGVYRRLARGGAGTGTHKEEDG